MKPIKMLLAPVFFVFPNKNYAALAYTSAADLHATAAKQFDCSTRSQ
jgi:hypothetical protein